MNIIKTLPYTGSTPYETVAASQTNQAIALQMEEEAIVMLLLN